MLLVESVMMLLMMAQELLLLLLLLQLLLLHIVLLLLVVKLRAVLGSTVADVFVACIPIMFMVAAGRRPAANDSF